ncbi:MAG: diaminobutyrate acetyltransferase, partial [Nitrosopumilaceae archaeon]|nr:diaminobutyrate acetyltransferase [Nitrosopumilaceae archaeon]NIU87921.1 diaminobutyrate acetyltransferase [Nitrosopumilaceae archaeon]NIV66205.1 diaminobutyrate acetyltransferase [Nitrosopumilaceae archaeon]NIX62096.1 diaminobutyrate acetyltransferase [Nitrosopumilaceae archaeon]
PLDINSEYLYILICHHFSKTSVVAVDGSTVAGFISGYIPPAQPDTLFIWQVATAENYRKKGLALKMAKNILARSSCNNVKFIEATVTPSNVPSRKFFESLANEMKGEFKIGPLFTKEHFFSASHEQEDLIKIGPIQRTKLEVN